MQVFVCVGLVQWALVRHHTSPRLQETSLRPSAFIEARHGGLLGGHIGSKRSDWQRHDRGLQEVPLELQPPTSSTAGQRLRELFLRISRGESLEQNV